MAVEVPRDELRTLISTLSGVPESRVYWDGEPERTVGLWGASGKAGKITLDVVARASLGGEEMRINDDEEEILGGTRVLTISCRADNFLGMGEAFDTLEYVRLRLLRRSSRAALRDAGLAYVDAPSITTIDYSVDNRAISSAVLDIRLSQVVTDAPPQEGPDATEFIEKVTTKSTGDIAGFPDVSGEPVVYLPFVPDDS